jgi:hypothetical protein
MSRLTVVRRAGSGVVATVLALSVVAAGGAAQAAPADHAADWLSKQLTNGLIHNDQFDFDDYGLTIDTAFALKAVGGHGSDVRQIRNALAPHVDSYTTGVDFGSSAVFAGAVAKLLVLTEVTHADPRNFGGVNLVKRLNGLVRKSGPAAGRIHDVEDPANGITDNANTIGQILAVRGLTGAKSPQAGKARRFLLEQQCRQGYFRLTFSKPNSSHQSCGPKSAPDPDATSYAVVQLWKTSKGNAELRAALKHAVAWLQTQQRRSGAFTGGTSTAAPNTNSTGLAAWALGLTGHCSAAKAAATWVAAYQVGPQHAGSKLIGQRGAIAYDGAALRAGRRDGITTETQDQWRRATSQAAPALLFRHGC